MKEHLWHQASIEGEQYIIFIHNTSSRFQKVEMLSLEKKKSKETESKVADRAMQVPDQGQIGRV